MFPLASAAGPVRSSRSRRDRRSAWYEENRRLREICRLVPDHPPVVRLNVPCDAQATYTIPFSNKRPGRWFSRSGQNGTFPAELEHVEESPVSPVPGTG